MADEGQAGIDPTIALMDDYYLTKDEFDTIMELGLEDSNGEVLLKNVTTAIKTAFTRQ